ncbi:MAG TPA: acyloxyacyl hydrolase [Dyella sp.]|uniref:acyloxyacyl hydrolase n=1 Tax=Dyella sp. TaxID=1869338 RepID=UPI002F92B643
MRLITFARSALALALLGLTLPAAAARLEIQGGRSYMDSHGTNAAFVEFVTDDSQIGHSNFTWAGDFSLGYINGRDIARYRNTRYGTTDDVKLLAGGVRLQYGSDDDWYHGFFWAPQVAVLSGKTIALSSTGEFVNTVGYQFKHWSLQIRHVSNAGIHDPNRGETMALVGFAFNL